MLKWKILIYALKHVLFNLNSSNSDIIIGHMFKNSQMFHIFQ